MKNKIYIGLGIIALFILGMGSFFIFQLQKVTTSFEQFEGGERIIILALDFNVENFHTQLEMWEYAFDPNQKRLEAFREHQKKLNELLNILVVSSQKDEATLFAGGISEIDNIRADVEQVSTDWERMLTIISGGDEEAIHKVVIANEELFDRLEFNKNVDAFVVKQNAFVAELEEGLFAPIRSLNTELLMFLVGMLVLIAGIGMWMSASGKEGSSQ